MSRLSKNLDEMEFGGTLAGAGVLAGTGSIVESSVSRVGGIIRTDVLVDLTGMNDGGTIDDIIGNDGGAIDSWIVKITDDVNGVILAATVYGHELPAGGDPDIDFWSASDGTLAQDTLITAAADEVLLVDAGDMSATSVVNFTAWPADGTYIYMACGTNTAADYTAGRFILSLWGQVV